MTVPNAPATATTTTTTSPSPTTNPLLTNYRPLAGGGAGSSRSEFSMQAWCPNEDRKAGTATITRLF
jgi:hypothetical protein